MCICIGCIINYQLYNCVPSRIYATVVIILYTFVITSTMSCTLFTVFITITYNITIIKNTCNSTKIYRIKLQFFIARRK